MKATPKSNRSHTEFDCGTWLEAEMYAGQGKRKACVRVGTVDGPLKVVPCRRADTFFSIPSSKGSWISIETIESSGERVLVLNNNKE